MQRKRKAVRHVNERLHSAHRIATVSKGASERHNDKAKVMPTGDHASVMPKSAASHSSDSSNRLGCSESIAFDPSDRLRQNERQGRVRHTSCNGATCNSPSLTAFPSDNNGELCLTNQRFTTMM